MAKVCSAERAVTTHVDLTSPDAPIVSASLDSNDLMNYAELVRRDYPNYADEVVIYSAGVESIDRCYPNRGFQRLMQGSRNDPALRRERLRDIIASLYPDLSKPPSYCVDCFDLRTDPARRPRGHLGTHKDNLMAFLHPTWFQDWRIQRYIELYILLQTDEMLAEEKFDSGGQSIGMKPPSWLTVCKEGKHRSYGWQWVESCILSLLGIPYTIVAVCRYAQTQIYCQRPGQRWPHVDVHPCPDCLFTTDDETKMRIAEFYINEFYEVVLCLEEGAWRESSSSA